MVAAIIAAQSLGKTEQKMYNLIRKKKGRRNHKHIVLCSSLMNLVMSASCGTRILLIQGGGNKKIKL